MRLTIDIRIQLLNFICRDSIYWRACYYCGRGLVLVRQFGVGLSHELLALIEKAAECNHQSMAAYMRDAALGEAERLMAAIPLDVFGLNDREPIGKEVVSVRFWAQDKERVEMVAHLLYRPVPCFIRDATIVRLASEGFLGVGESSVILHDIKSSRPLILE